MNLSALSREGSTPLVSCNCAHHNFHFHGLAAEWNQPCYSGQILSFAAPSSCVLSSRNPSSNSKNMQEPGNLRSIYLHRLLYSAEFGCLAVGWHRPTRGGDLFLPGGSGGWATAVDRWAEVEPLEWWIGLITATNAQQQAGAPLCRASPAAIHMPLAPRTQDSNNKQIEFLLLNVLNAWTDGWRLNLPVKR